MPERIDLNEILRRVEAATPGPWFIDKHGIVRSDAYEDEIPGVAWNADIDWHLTDEDADFIAAAREDVPALVHALNDALGLLDENIRMMDAWRTLFPKTFGEGSPHLVSPQTSGPYQRTEAILVRVVRLEKENDAS